MVVPSDRRIMIMGLGFIIVATDAKSRTSANGHLIDIYSRSEGVPVLPITRFGEDPTFTAQAGRTQKQTTTHQTYMFFSEWIDNLSH